ncbi:carboxymuconolactone decarboxylase family protein [Chitinophaga sp. CF118]|uniref:carboxymuconolactone decarboxylase family protein n=1 Tax=Chitinophaga sp. CF118 TaxID=1884367 RepID=UPI000B7D9CDD
MSHLHWDLVYLRASQINGCAFCLDMHSFLVKTEAERQGIQKKIDKPMSNRKDENY